MKRARNYLEAAMQTIGFTGIPYLPLALVALSAAFGLSSASILPAMPSGAPPQVREGGTGVSLTAPGGAGHSPGLPVEDTRRRSDGPTDREIRDRARPWELKRLESDPWKLLLSDRLALRGDVGADALRTLAVHAELTLDALSAELGGDLSDIRFSVRAFRDEHEFDVYASIAGAKGAASFYDPRNAEAVVRWDRDAREAVIRLLRHEVAHLYMDRVFRLTSPLWLCEGVAQRFEHATWDKGALVPGADMAAARTTLRDAIGSGTFVPLRRLLAARRDEFYDPDRWQLYYAESWSLVKRLAASEGLLKKLVTGGKLGELVDLAALEKEWRSSLTE
jgi:hypothetical protein